MFLGFINTKLAAVINYSPFGNFIPLLFYQPLFFPFFREKSTFLHFLENKQNSITIPFEKCGRCSYD